MTRREARFGGLSVGVPGIPRGIEKLLKGVLRLWVQSVTHTLSHTHTL